MPVMDEFKKERETIRHAPLSKKLEYFKDYYLMKTLLILFVVIVGGSYLFSVITRKETALYVTLVNFNLTQESSEPMIEPFAREHINTRKQEIVIDSSSYISSDKNEINFVKYGYEDEQRLFSMVMTGEIDLFITGEDVINRYAEQEWFDDLHTILNASDLSELENRILSHNGIPIAIRIDETSILNKYYFYNGRQGETLYAGFPAGGKNRELAYQFIQYLMQ